ncbi:MAG: S1C family serine protease [Gammaproteobacteria bacterium]|nr:S1C family serine protease [Gammaproteobacteria bacterium]
MKNNLFKKIMIGVFALTFSIALCGCSVTASSDSAANSTAEKNAYELAVEDGYQGSINDWILSLLENDSYENVYDLAVSEGLFDGTLEDFIESLKGEDGNTSVVSSAATTLTSTVSIFCKFTVTTSSGGGFFGRGGTTTSEATSAGSGVIYKLEDDGTAYILTNYHVVYYVDADTQISDEIYVYLYGMEYDGYELEATYIGGSMQYDIAILKVKSDYLASDSGNPYHAVTLANSTDLQVGESVIAVGNPEGEGLSVTYGIVSVRSESITMYLADEKTTATRRVIRIDAAVNAGNSGGGLYNTDGELIGIVNAKTVDEEVEGMCYAIPINVASAIADKIISTCNGTSILTIKRVYIGIEVSIASSKASYDTTTGVLSIIQEIKVSSVSSSGDAYGILKTDDIIVNVTFEGVTYPVTSSDDLEDVILMASVGDSIDLYILRGGNYKTVTVTFSSESTVK